MTIHSVPVDFPLPGCRTRYRDDLFSKSHQRDAKTKKDQKQASHHARGALGMLSSPSEAPSGSSDTRLGSVKKGGKSP